MANTPGIPPGNRPVWLPGDQLEGHKLNAAFLQILANLPAAGYRGRLILRNNVLYHDTGTNIVELVRRDAPANIASLRTIGNGARQIAAGNHTHN